MGQSEGLIRGNEPSSHDSQTVIHERGNYFKATSNPMQQQVSVHFEHFPAAASCSV